jgi:hypothetical protein
MKTGRIPSVKMRRVAAKDRHKVGDFKPRMPRTVRLQNGHGTPKYDGHPALSEEERIRELLGDIPGEAAE